MSATILVECHTLHRNNPRRSPFAAAFEFQTSAGLSLVKGLKRLFVRRVRFPRDQELQLLFGQASWRNSRQFVVG